MLTAVQSLRRAGSEGDEACWVARVRSLAGPGLWGDNRRDAGSSVPGMGLK